MSDPRQENAKGRLIPMPAAAPEASPATVSGDAVHDGLDALFLATRQVEAAVHRERAQKEKLQQELQALRYRYSQDMAKAQAAIRELASRQEELRTQLAHFQQLKATLEEKSRSLAEKLESAQSELARKGKEGAETIEKLRMELELTRSALARSQEQGRQIEQALTTLRPQFESLKQENELGRSETAERERKYKAAIQSYDAYQKSLLAQLAAARDELMRAQGEVQHLRGAKSAADEAKRRLDAYAAKIAELKRELDRAGAANQSLNAALHQERQRRNEFARAAQGGQEERESLRSQLGLAEHRLADAESRVSELSQQLAQLRAERWRAEALDREAQAATLRAPAPMPKASAPIPEPPAPPPRQSAGPGAAASGASAAGAAIPEFLIREAGAAFDGIDDEALVGYPIGPSV